MEDRIYDSELRVLEFLWQGGTLSAREIAARAAEEGKSVGEICPFWRT